MKKEEKNKVVPIWNRALLTLEETAAYTGIGIGKLRSMSESEDCKYVMWVGNRRMFKRAVLDEFLEKAYSV